MRFSAVVLCTPLLLLGLPRAALSQSETHLGIELAAARHIASILRDGKPSLRIALEHATEHGKTLSSAGHRAALQAIRVVGGSADTLIHCGNSFSTCRMHGVDAVVSVTLSAVTDTTAIVKVKVQEATTSTRVPIKTTVKTLLFTKKDTVWVFTRQVGRTFMT